MTGRPTVLRRILRAVAAVFFVAATATALAEPAIADTNDAAIVVDGKTGEVLYASNADAQRYPASLTKMLTLYILFEDLERGRVTLQTDLHVSQNAANQAPTKLGVPAGGTIDVEDAIFSLVTLSANDIAVVIAENLEGSVSAFAQRMNTTAHAIGMTHSNFRNPNGLPDSQQYTTARDMATLGRALQDRFPQYYPYFSTPSFTWQGRTISTHDNLLDDPGVDGIKTGYTNASGYNLVTSVHRDDRFVVGVVLGGATTAARDQHMRDLISTYMPHASNGARTAPLVVAMPSAVVPAPLPRPNPARLDPIMTASVQQPATPPAPVLMTAAAEQTPPMPDPIAILAQGDADTSSGSGTPAEPPPGWRIQLGAFPSETAAQAVLARAQQVEGTLLNSVTPYTETVVVGGANNYRARFAGFANSTAAEAACHRLEAEDFDCWATQ